MLLSTTTITMPKSKHILRIKGKILSIPKPSKMSSFPKGLREVPLQSHTRAKLILVREGEKEQFQSTLRKTSYKEMAYVKAKSLLFTLKKEKRVIEK